MISLARVSRGICLGFVALVVEAGIGAGPAAAATAPAPLSRVVVARSLPGFSLVPQKVYDGPIPKPTLDGYSEQPQWKQDVADGRLTGFVRAWGRVYQRGPALIYMSAVRMPDAAFAPVFTSSIGTLAARQPGAAAYTVSGIQGATAYRTSPPVQVGTVTGYWIIFTRGNFGFFLYAVVRAQSVTAGQVASVARQQAARASGG